MRRLAGQYVRSCKGWGFDAIAMRHRQTVRRSRAYQQNIVDLVFTGIAALSRVVHRGLAFTQNGRVRWYAANMAAGAVLILLVVLGVL
jgi:NADH-quinone oxidoreductase subunit L